MGGKSSPKPPPAPDPAATARAQGAANKEAIVESARVNAVDISGPFGRTYYRRNADGTPAEQITQLTQPAQNIYDGQMGVAQKLTDTAVNRVQGLPQGPFTLDGVPYDPRNVNTNNMPTYQRNVESAPRYQATQFDVNRFQDPTRGSTAPGLSFGAGSPPPGQGGGVQPGQGASQAGPFTFGAPRGMTPAAQAAVTGLAFGSNLPYDPRTTNVQRYADEAGDAAFRQATRRLDPQFARAEQNFEQRMAERGIPITGENYRALRSDFEMNRTDAYGQAADRAREVAGSEAQRMLGMEQGLRQTAFNEDQTNRTAFMRDLGQYFNQGQSADQQQFDQALATNQQQLAGQQQQWQQGVGNFTAASQDQQQRYTQDQTDQQLRQADWMNRLQTEQNLRGQVTNDLLTERNQGINEISAIIQGSPAMGMPTAPNVPTYRMNPVDVAGITNSAYNAQMNNYNAQMQSRAAGMQGAMGLASAGLGLFGKSHPSYKVVIGDA